MGADWTERGFHAQGHRHNPSEDKLSVDNVSGLKKQWAFAAGGAIDCAIAVTDDHVFFGSFNQKVVAVNRATGAGAWDFTTGAFIDSSPAYDDGTVFIASNDGNVYAFHAANGTVKWQTPIGGVRFSSPALVMNR